MKAHDTRTTARLRGAAVEVILVAMTTLSRDTSPEAERVQINLLRQASVARRFEAARRLTETTIALAVKAIRETLPPDAGDDEVFVRFVEVHHGAELAGKLARYLERRKG